MTGVDSYSSYAAIWSRPKLQKKVIGLPVQNLEMKLCFAVAFGAVFRVHGP